MKSKSKNFKLSKRQMVSATRRYNKPAIRIFTWSDPSYNLDKWSSYKIGMPAMESASTSFRGAMKIVQGALKRGSCTHFVLSYPIRNWGGTTEGNPHDMYHSEWGRDLRKKA